MERKQLQNTFANSEAQTFFSFLNVESLVILFEIGSIY